MEIIIAKSAGFCFGVNKAVSTVYRMLETSDRPIYTLGPVIHNEQLVNMLKEKGVKVIHDISQAENQGKVIIRAHGVVPEVYKQIEKKSISVEDATCPYVKKIHGLVMQKHAEGCQIVIAGDKNHPEVIGINGWCENSAWIVEDEADIHQLPETSKTVCVVAQTTLSNEKWEKILNYINKKFEKVIKFDTICNATNERQKEAAEIASKVDMMIVIGSKGSSNTQKLFEICKARCPKTFNIETFGDLLPVDINEIKKLGITAGASTPDWIIKEVIEKMEEMNKLEGEMSFKEAFESSLVTLQSGEIVKGRIISFNNAEVYVDMGYKSDGVIPIEEFTDDPDFNPDTDLKVGEEIEVFIVRVNDGEGNVLLSKKKVDAVKTWDKLEDAFNNKTTVKVKVVDITKGGVVASTGGVRVFIPASQIGDRFVKDLNEYNKKVINVRIIELNKAKKKVVASERVILKEEKSRFEAEFWSSVEVGKTYEGTVKSLTDFGAFVDIGGVDGLVHVTELSWTRIKHPSEVVKVGDKITVSILDFDKEKKKISLGYKKPQDDPWYKIEEKYKVGDIVKGKVARLVPFGAFIELQKGVDGLVHISQISSVRIAKPGDVLEVGSEVEAKVIDVNAEAKKINLSIKEVAPIDPAPVKTVEAVKSDEGEELPSEHTEAMNVSIGDVLANVDVKDEQ